MILIPTILCGGAGSRLWPLSRTHHPKPFIRLSDGQSLLQKAFLRGVQQSDVREVLTVTNRELMFKTEDEFREVNERNISTSFILEPFGKNTAAAIAAAVLRVSHHYGDDAVMLVLAADHLISDIESFSNAVQKATKLATSGRLVTLGIQPNVPETGYGYIEASGTDVIRFVEKPHLNQAKEYVESGRYLWNSGIFCFTAGTMLKQMKIHCPDIVQSIEVCIACSQSAYGNGFEQIELDANTFIKVREDSIDYAVFERSSDISVVPCDIGWSDVGSWNALSELIPSDEAGNRIDGDVQLHEVTNCFIHSETRLVGAVGVHDLVIVETPDAILVADSKRTQDVKQIYTQLKRENHDTHKMHRTVYRPWGSYTVLEESANFKIKRIVVNPKSSLSLQLHQHRSEHWIVVSGEAKIVKGKEEMTIFKDESTYIPAGCKHRLSNLTDNELVLIEVQTGQYVDEEDIVRFEDNYGRC